MDDNVKKAIQDEFIAAFRKTRNDLADHTTDDDFCVALIAACSVVVEELSDGLVTVAPCTKAQALALAMLSVIESGKKEPSKQ